MSAHTRQASRSRSGGFTLIEVLVALIILAIGVLGIVALQVSTYRQLHTSHNYTAAAILAGDMADRMLANPVQALNDAYNHTDGQVAQTDCAAEDCTAAELAEFDIAQWQAHVTGLAADAQDGDVPTPGSLPSATAAVARVAGTDDFTIVVRWDDDLSGSAGTDCAALDPNAVQDPNDLDCYVLTFRVR